MKRKKPIRWDWIEEQWQLGRLSNYQIAAEHKAKFGRETSESSIRKRATAEGWHRSAENAIRRETWRKLANKSAETVDTCAHFSAQESARNLVDVASNEQAEITLQHREDAKRIRVSASLLELHLVEALKVGPDGLPVNRFDSSELKDLATVVDKANAQRQRAIEIERKAYNLDEKETGKVVIEFANENHFADSPPWPSETNC